MNTLLIKVAKYNYVLIYKYEDESLILYYELIKQYIG